MPITIHCENAVCLKPLRVRDELAGKRIKCPSCGHVMAAPARSNLTSPGKTRTFTGASLVHRIEIPFEKKHPSVDSVAVDSEGRIAVSAHFDRVVRVWDTATGKLKHTLAGHEAGVESVAMTPDGKFAISGSATGDIRLWDLATGACIRPFDTQKNRKINSVSLSADGKLALSNRDANDPIGEKPFLLWDVTTGRVIRTFESVPRGMIGSGSISPDGRFAVSGAQDKIVRLWDVPTGRTSAELNGHSAFVYAVGVSAGGKRVISGADDSLVKVWDVATKECVATLEGSVGTVGCVALSGDGTVALSRDNDQDVRVWDVAAKKCLATLTGHSNRVSASLNRPRRPQHGCRDLDKSLQATGTFAAQHGFINGFTVFTPRELFPGALFDALDLRQTGASL